jgi:hypothetical protein
MIRYRTMAARPQSKLATTPFHYYTVDDDTVWTEFHRSGDGYLLRFPDLADFEVSADGKEVVAWPANDDDGATVEHLYINQMVPLALSRQGRPTFHASVVTVPGGVIAFLGQSGMGKSTLAASFALNGASFLSDDALLVEETESGCLVQPSHPSIRLWEDSVEQLVDASSSTSIPISYSTKARLLAGDALTYSAEPQRLLAAYVLESNDASQVAIRTLAGVDRHMAWVQNSFLLDIEDADLLKQHFDWTHRIASAIPTFALDYPRDYGILPEVRNAVQQHAAISGI